MGKCCVPKSSYVSYMHLYKNQVLRVGVLVTLVFKHSRINFVLLLNIRTYLIHKYYICVLLPLRIFVTSAFH
jgi:hypothetical protein